MNPFKKLLHLPGPEELGRSDGDWLESRDFSPFTKAEYTWEDWEAEMRSRFPVRWFLARTVPCLVRALLLRPLERAWDWVAYHTFRRFHLLDLRTSDYRYGYLDPCEALRLACWASLVSYVEECRPRDPADWATVEELQDPHLARQKAVHDELIGLYGWWKTGRFEDEAAESEKFDAVRAAVRARDEAAHAAASAEWIAFREANEAKAEAKLLRLVELRRHLWT